jgi:hypothetical protein
MGVFPLRVPGRYVHTVSEGVWTMLAALFSNLAVTLLVEGGIFLALAVGIRLGRRTKSGS